MLRAWPAHPPATHLRLAASSAASTMAWPALSIHPADPSAPCPSPPCCAAPKSGRSTPLPTTCNLHQESSDEAARSGIGHWALNLQVCAPDYWGVCEKPGVLFPKNTLAASPLLRLFASSFHDAIRCGLDVIRLARGRPLCGGWA